MRTTPPTSRRAFPAWWICAAAGYKLSIVKSCDGNAASVQRQTFDYPQPVAGEGHFISTYVKNDAPHPQLCRGADAHRHRRERRQSLCEKLWASLNENNKVSLFVRTITLETGNYEDTIVNKYNAVEG